MNVAGTGGASMVKCVGGAIGENVDVAEEEDVDVGANQLVSGDGLVDENGLED